MKKLSSLLVLIALSLTIGCANTVYKQYEGKNTVFEGKGGTKVVVDGIEIWDNGEPPSKFKLLGIIDDSRPGGLIPMARQHSDMAKKAREAGGDAIIQLSSETQIKGYHTTSQTSFYYGKFHGSAVSMPYQRNKSKFMVIKYLD